MLIMWCKMCPFLAGMNLYLVFYKKSYYIQIINIAYKDGTEGIAAERVNVVSQAFIEESQKLLPSGSAKIMDKALVPQAPITPNKKLNIAISYILGLMLSLGLVFII